MSLTGSMTATLSAKQVPTGPTQSTAQDKIADSAVFDFTNGSGDDQANLIWREDYTVAGSATQTIDLVGGALTDRFGAAVSFATIKGIIVTVQTASGQIDLSPAAAAGFDDLFGAGADIPIKEGGVLCAFWPNTGIAVAGGADSLTFTNPGGSNVTFQVTIIGTSA